MNIRLLTFLFSALCLTGLAQNNTNYELIVNAIDLSEKEFNKKVRYKTTNRDSVEAIGMLNDIKLQLIEQSYLSASIDSIATKENKIYAYVMVGPSFKWAQLKKGNVDEEVLSKTGYRDKFFNRSTFSQKQITKLFERIIVLYENQGYPFASIELDSVVFKDEIIEANLKLTKHQLIKIDSIRMFGDSKVARSYLYNYIGVKPGDLYNEHDIRKIGQRLDELPFVNQSKPYNVAFTATNTILNLYLDKRNANRFDGIVGVLPDEDDGRVQITGDVKLRLLNSFNRGELINFNWRRLANSSQDLKFKFNYPYLFNTPFGADFDFKLYRRDTTFIDIYLKYGIQYMWRANNYLKAFINNKNSNLLSTSQYENTTILPPFADISSNLYGIALNLEKLDYRFNPKKGYSMYIEGEVGTKKIIRNNELNPVIYEGLKLNSNLYNLMTDIDFYIRLSKIMVLNIGNQSAYTFNENIFENELFRIGGLNILRGFDEESIFASVYFVNTLEYRIILEKNSYWYLFFDGAYYENKNVGAEGLITDTPFGFGTGITFQTNAGIFSLNYALGRQFGNPIEFRAAKIHFGFVNYF